MPARIGGLSAVQRQPSRRRMLESAKQESRMRRAHTVRHTRSCISHRMPDGEQRMAGEGAHEKVRPPQTAGTGLLTIEADYLLTSARRVGLFA